jgi:hypothetical protein
MCITALSQKPGLLSLYPHKMQNECDQLVQMHRQDSYQYPGYEPGTYYFKDTLTGHLIITSIWKRERR